MQYIEGDVTIHVKMAVSDDVEIGDMDGFFVDVMDESSYMFSSNTEGVDIYRTEVTDYNNVQEDEG